MRRLWAALLFLLLYSALARAQSPLTISGFCINGAKPAITSGMPSSNYNQNLIPKCTVQVFLHGTTTPAVIFKDAIGTPLDNPFTANTDASWSFNVPAAATGQTVQSYDVTLSGGIAPNAYGLPRTLPNLNGGGGGGGGGAMLQVNGTSNQSQALLNLVNGPNISVTDLGSGAVQFSATGTIAGTTSPNFVPYATNTNTLGNSAAFWDATGAATFTLPASAEIGLSSPAIDLTGSTEIGLTAPVITATAPVITVTASSQINLNGPAVNVPSAYVAGRKVFIDIAGTTPGSGYTVAPTVTMSGGTCSVPPILIVSFPYEAMWALIQNQNTASCTVAPTVTLTGGTFVTPATILLSLQGATVSAGPGGLLAPQLQTGTGLAVRNYQPSISAPYLDQPILTSNFNSYDRYPALWLQCQGGTFTAFLQYANNLQIVQPNCPGLPNNIGFYSGPFLGASFGSLDPAGLNATGYLQITGTGNVAIDYVPERSSVLSTPQRVGEDYFLTTSGALTSAGGFIGTGYPTSGSGTCTLTGGVGSGGSCTAIANGSGGATVTVAGGTYSVPPVTNVTFGSGTGASATVGIAAPLTVTSTLYVDPITKTLNYAQGNHTNFFTPYFATGPNGTVVGNPAGYLQGAGTFNAQAVYTGGANIIFRCLTAGTLPAGALTAVAGNCGTSIDSGLRTQ